MSGKYATRAYRWDMPNPIERLIAPVDEWQQQRQPFAFVVAVFLRYGDDRGSQYSALLSYYGFISLFPLLIVFVTVLGMVLDGNESLRNDILTTTFARIPVIGAQLRQSTESIDGNGFALIVGIGVTLWAGLGVVQAAQDALNRQWRVPYLERPGFFPRLVRGLGALGVVGVGIIAATAGTIVAANASGLGGTQQVFAAIAAIVVNIAVLGRRVRSARPPEARLAKRCGRVPCSVASRCGPHS